MSGENLDLAYKTLLDKNPDIESWLRETTNRARDYAIGGAALVAAVAVAIWITGNDVLPIGGVDDIPGWTIIAGLVKFAFQRFGIAT